VRGLKRLRNKSLLLDITKSSRKIIVPQLGAYNPGIEQIPNTNKYVMVYRSDERKFVGCILNESFVPESDTYFRFRFNNCADPRLIWHNNKLLMIYSCVNAITVEDLKKEYVSVAIIMDLDKSMNFVDEISYRVSPVELGLQKNWIPFKHDNKIYLIANICPHNIYELNIEEMELKHVHKTHWNNCWIYPQHQLRGSTPPVLLDDGNYLGTFHTAVVIDNKYYYDNGCYLFEGVPPFKVLKCGYKTFLPAESAVENHLRMKDLIVCNFPVGMIRQQERIMVSYGDNDSAVKIMETTCDEMLNTLTKV